MIRNIMASSLFCAAHDVTIRLPKFGRSIANLWDRSEVWRGLDIAERL